MTLYARPSIRTDAPDATPVTLAEAKAHLNAVDFTDDDTLITALIQAATDYLDGPDGILGRALVTQGWDHFFDGYGDYCLRLPLCGGSSIQFDYLDVNGAAQTLSADQYQVVEDNLTTCIIPAAQASWPALHVSASPVTISAVHGFGAAADVPQPIKQAMLLMIGDWYENRESVGSARTAAIPFAAAVHALLSPYRRTWVAA